MPSFGVFHPEWRQATGNSPWPLGTCTRAGESAISAGFSHSAVVEMGGHGVEEPGQGVRARPGSQQQDGLGHRYHRSASRQHGRPLLLGRFAESLGGTGGEFCCRPCPLILLPPKRTNTQCSFSVPTHREAGLA